MLLPDAHDMSVHDTLRHCLLQVVKCFPELARRQADQAVQVRE
jgi:hypothetical protein